MTFRSIVFSILSLATISSPGTVSYACDTCTAPVPCSIGRSWAYGPGYDAIFANGKEVATPYSSIEDALNALSELQSAGVCSKETEGPCSIGRSGIYGDGYNAVFVNGKEVATPYSSVEDALNALSELQSAGICSSVIETSCSIGRSWAYGPGYDAIFANGKEVATPYSSIEDALNALSELQSAGVCSKETEGPCSIGRSGIYGDGYNAVFVNGKEVATPYSSVEDALNALSELQSAGICSSVIETSCSIGRSRIYGDGYNAVFADSKEVATPYSSIEDALNALSELQSAGLCKKNC